jgi:hypothetical protein
MSGKEVDYQHFPVRYQEEQSLNNLLASWVLSSPSSDSEFLDPFAGYGIEAGYLRSMGFDVKALERFPSMRESAKYPVVAGNFFQMKFPPDHFGGILVKDAWLFLDPKKRTAFLRKSFEILVRGGSILIVSKLNSTYRACLSEGSLDFTLTTSDTGGNVNTWKKLVKKEKERGTLLVAVEYPCVPEQIHEQAEKLGFVYEQVICYGVHDRLAIENRWERKPGFIVKLTKP